MLHRLLRGTGLRGLRGIASRRPLVAGVEVVRPAPARHTGGRCSPTCVRKAKTSARDSSNRDLRLTRNRIRSKLLPHLAGHYNSAVAGVLCRLAEQAGEVCRGEEERARGAAGGVRATAGGGRAGVRPAALGGAPRHLVREVFRQAWLREGWPQRAMGFDDWDRLAEVACGERAAVDLPGGVRARLQERVVQVGRALEGEPGA